MRLNHKKIYDKLAKQFWLVYYKGKWGITPKNYTVFYKKKNDWLQTEVLQIESIPAGKYLKTLYVMFINMTNETYQKQVYELLKNEYESQTKWQGVSWCMDFNNHFAWFLF